MTPNDHFGRKLLIPPTPDEHSGGEHSGGEHSQVEHSQAEHSKGEHQQGKQPSPERLGVPPLPAGRPNLILAGFMGSGKTTVGRCVANQGHQVFVDLDEALCAETGLSIPAIFTQRGEAGFRVLERRILKDAARLSGAVVATGGGAVLHRPAFSALAATGHVRVLGIESHTVLERVGEGDQRPLLQNDQAAALLAERRSSYRAAGPIIPTDDRTVEEVSSELLALLDSDRGALVTVSSPVSPYRVRVGTGSLSQLPADLGEAVATATVAVVVAEPTVRRLAERVASLLRDAGLEVVRHEAPGGEAGKTLDAVREVWNTLRRHRVSRSDVLIAVGGGATTDMAGFAAATYSRGIPFVTVPTTLLGMVDASVGGKTGIDYADTKNLIGAFHDPALVVADPAVLATLDVRDVRAGLAEVVKVAVCASPLVLHVLETCVRDGRDLPEPVDWLVEQAVRIKAGYVAADPHDRDVRQALNLGHTFAHALESATHYALRHGEAVAIGTVAAARLGEREGVTPPGLARRLCTLLARLGLPVAAPRDLDQAAALEAMGADKKRRGRQQVFILPSDDGVVLHDALDPRDALTALWDDGADVVSRS